MKALCKNFSRIVADYCILWIVHEKEENQENVLSVVLAAAAMLKCMKMKIIKIESLELSSKKLIFLCMWLETMFIQFYFRFSKSPSEFTVKICYNSFHTLICLRCCNSRRMESVEYLRFKVQASTILLSRLNDRNQIHREFQLQPLRLPYYRNAHKQILYTSQYSCL